MVLQLGYKHRLQQGTGRHQLLSVCEASWCCRATGLFTVHWGHGRSARKKLHIRHKGPGLERVSPMPETLTAEEGQGSVALQGTARPPGHGNMQEDKEPHPQVASSSCHSDKQMTTVLVGHL